MPVDPMEEARERLESLGRIIDPEVWACRDRNPNSTPLTCHDIRASLAKADAIIALSAPAGGG